MIYVRWSISIMSLFIGFRSLVTSQWHIEKDKWMRTRCRVNLTYAVRNPSAQVGIWKSESNWRAPGKARVRILLESLHRRIRSIVQQKGGHMPYQMHYCYVVSLVNCYGINSYVDISIWSYPYTGNKMLRFAHFSSFDYIYLQQYHLCKTRYVDGTPTSEVTPFTILYIRPPHHGHTGQYRGHEWMTHILFVSCQSAAPFLR